MLLSSRTPTLRRGVAQLVVAATVATVGVLVPTPVLAEVSEAQTHTEVVALDAPAADRTGDPVATSEATEVRAALDEPERQAEERATSAFQAIGLTVAVVPSSAVLVRARHAGAWGPWYEASFEGDGPDAGAEGDPAGVHSAPVWVGDADAYEVDAPPEVARVQVHLVGEVVTRRELKLAEAAASAAGAPDIRARSAWGARPPRQTPVTVRDLRVAVVHHSVTANGYSAAEVPAILRSIQAYHQDVNGWDDIAYNFAVDRFGQIWEARAGGTDQVVLGGHSKGFNTGTTGVVVLGDYSSATVPSATLEAVSRVIAWKFAIHRVDPASTVPVTSGGSSKYAEGRTVTLSRVVGHRDVQLTGCPGDGIYARLGTIRSRVAQLVPSYQQGALPELLSGDFTGDGLTDALAYRAGSSAPDTFWRATGAGFATQSRPVSGAYRPAVGDFDGDGLDDIIWHGTGTTADSLWWGRAAGPSSMPLSVRGSYVPVVGDYDGDGRDDIYWYSAGLGADFVWYFGADRRYATVRADQDLNTGRPLVGDFDRDGRDDIFWYGPGSTADDWLWVSTGRAFRETDAAVNGRYDPVVLDANVDGFDDILWVQPGSTRSYRWDFRSGGAYASLALTTPASSGRPLVGDFDGDGDDDAFLYAPGGAADHFWYSTPGGVQASAAPVNGSYGVAVGPMDGVPGTPGSTDDLLYVALARAYWWRLGPGQTYRSAAVG